MHRTPHFLVILCTVWCVSRILSLPCLCVCQKVLEWGGFQTPPPALCLDTVLAADLGDGVGVYTPAAGRGNQSGLSPEHFLEHPITGSPG